MLATYSAIVNIQPATYQNLYKSNLFISEQTLYSFIKKIIRHVCCLTMVTKILKIMILKNTEALQTHQQRTVSVITTHYLPVILPIFISHYLDSL